MGFLRDREDDAMSISRTTFRLIQRSELGPEAMSAALLALRAVIPYAQIDCVQLNRTKFWIDSSRYPQAIWHQLLQNPEWHTKLVFHLANSLVARDHAERCELQGDFGNLLNDPETHVILHGSMLFESEGTPALLAGQGLPMMESFGCELQVDAYTEYVKQVRRDELLGEKLALQQSLYRSLPFGDSMLISAD
jgi:hypothetical protein